MFTIVYISLVYQITNKFKFMQHFSNFLMVFQFILFVIVVSNMAKLFTDYLLTKIK